MITAWTKTEDLDKKTRKQICLLTADWCAKNMGVSYRGRPKIKIRKSKNLYGLYDPYKEDHDIKIFKNQCENVYRLVSVTIHEWKHSLQKAKKSYTKLYREHGYDKHPMEIEARQAEKMWNKCWRDIKSQIQN